MIRILACILAVLPGLALGERTAPTHKVPVAIATEPTADWAIALSDAISACWNTGLATPDEKATIVRVRVDFDHNGNVENTTLLGYDGPTADAVEPAYQAARRAIMRCATSTKIPLPKDHYAAWRQIDITFDPNPVGTK